MAPNEVRNNRILVIDDNAAIHEDIRKVLGANKARNDFMADAKAMLFDEETSKTERIQFEIDSAYQGEEGFNLVRQRAAEGRNQIGDGAAVLADSQMG